MSKIIFLHGGPGFKDYLSPYFGKSIAGYECVYYDQRQASDLSMEDLIEQLDAMICDKAVLLGHSWGGVLATEYTKRFPLKVESLILMSTGLSSYQWTLYNDELDQLGKGEISKEELFFTEKEMSVGKVLFEHECWSGFSEESFESVFESYLKHYDLLPCLSHMEASILNIYGEKDFVCLLNLWDKMGFSKLTS
jgi:esterase/lipase